MENKNWIIKGKVRQLIESDLIHHSFIYRINLTDGRWYIGRKKCSGNTINALNKYNSSNSFIKANTDQIISKTILYFTESKIDTTYYEMKEIIDSGWLDEKCLNNSILGKFYKTKISNNI